MHYIKNVNIQTTSYVAEITDLPGVFISQTEQGRAKISFFIEGNGFLSLPAHSGWAPILKKAYVLNVRNQKFMRKKN
jgi:hypothetical protein